MTFNGLLECKTRADRSFLPGNSAAACNDMKGQDMSARTIVIGDIHGCAEALNALIDVIDPTPDDRLIMLGDYVDRGPDSREVIDRLLALGDHCQLVPLLGNHELMLARAFESFDQLIFWLGYGGQQTVDSYGGDPRQIPREHIDFLRGCRHYFETETHMFVHANYQHDRPLSEQPEETLLWRHLSQGVPPPHCSGKKAFVGHTPQISGDILDLGHLACIDTYCCGGGWLTAVDVDSGRLWQASRNGQLRAG
jgi:serine/threonine protein phosphatase 1